MATISVIIPIYNSKRYLEKCLNSIVNQTFKDIEIICINDGSKDNSEKILENFALTDKRIKIINSKHRGISFARNKGIEIAKGKYCYFVDSDDWIELNTLEKLINIAENNNVDVVIHNALNVIEDDSCIKEAKRVQKYFDKRNKPNGIYDVPLDINRNITCTPWNKLYKMEIINKFNCKFPNGLIHEDVLFLWEYIIHCKNYYYLEDKLYYYFRRQDSTVIMANYSRRALDILRIHKLIYKTVEKQKDIRLYQPYITDYYLRTTEYLLEHTTGKYRKLAFKLIKEYYETINHDKKIIKTYRQYKYKEIRNFISAIFSIKNSKDKKQKIITIFGYKIKFKKIRLK